MPQILVWKCPHTGKLFESKTKYQTHLKKLSVERVAQRKKDAFRAERKAFFAHMRATVRTPAELEGFIKANWVKFCENAVLNDAWGRTKTKVKPYPKLEWIKIKATWSNSVSNSHRCPFGGETNWGGQKPNVPRGYPGWTGMLEYQVSDYQDGLHGSDMWDGTGVNTGTGGYASNYYYGLELFADDWPAMNEMREKVLTWKTLGNDQRHVDEIVADILQDKVHA